MASHEKFNFPTLESMRNKITELGVNITLSEDLSPLKSPVKVGTKNRAQRDGGIADGRVRF